MPSTRVSTVDVDGVVMLYDPRESSSDGNHEADNRVSDGVVFGQRRVTM